MAAAENPTTAQATQPVTSSETKPLLRLRRNQQQQQQRPLRNLKICPPDGCQFDPDFDHVDLDEYDDVEQLDELGLVDDGVGHVPPPKFRRSPQPSSFLPAAPPSSSRTGLAGGLSMDSRQKRQRRRSTFIDSQQQQPQHDRRPPSGLDLDRGGLFRFFWFELTRGYALENDEARYTEKRKKVYAFIKIPKELEKFLFYGNLQCLDAFLFVFTFLPLRFFMALVHLLATVFRPLAPKKLRGAKSSSSFSTPGEVCDILKVFIIFVASLLMTFIDTSVIYHVVRGQAVIKLYIFFNMLEVADKLFSSFGQDILDALFWTATEPKSGSRRTDRYFGTLPHLFLAILYVWAHTVLVLLQATTLNVAFNSHSKALLTIMLSNNFVELKGNVFKKFAKNNLFQMACSDVRERFHYFVLLSIVIVRNMTAVNWRVEHFFEMVPDLLLVIFGEILVDWIKHAFITKFNEIPFEVYKDFTITIAYDVAKSRDLEAFSDHSDQVSRRMGFIPLPLSVLVIRIVTQSFRFDNFACVLLWLLTFVGLLLFKMFNSILVLGKAARYIRTYEELQKQADFLKRLSKKRSKSVPSSPRLSLIEFSDVYQHSYPPKGFTVSDVLQQAAEMGASIGAGGGGVVSGVTPEEVGAALMNAKLKRRSKSVTYLKTMRRRNDSGDERTTTAGGGQQPSSSVVSKDPGQLTPIGGGVSGPEATTGGATGAGSSTSATAVPTPSAAPSSTTPNPTDKDMQALLGVDRYTLVNNDRIEP